MCNRAASDRLHKAYAGKNSCTVCLGVVLTAVGVYEPLVNLAGCGATTPLTGFGYSLAKGVQKAVDERGLIGAIIGGLTGTAGGITVAIVSGLIIGALFKEKEK